MKRLVRHDKEVKAFSQIFQEGYENDIKGDVYMVVPNRCVDGHRIGWAGDALPDPGSDNGSLESDTQDVEDLVQEDADHTKKASPIRTIVLLRVIVIDFIFLAFCSQAFDIFTISQGKSHHEFLLASERPREAKVSEGRWLCSFHLAHIRFMWIFLGQGFELLSTSNNKYRFQSY